MTLSGSTHVTFLVFSIATAVTTQGSWIAAQDSTQAVDPLVVQLTSEDERVAEAARQSLEGMGPDIVPGLFEKLLNADWTLKPRLLEVLSAHGREFVKETLFKGNEKEKIHAALVYELSVSRAVEGFKYDTAEFKAMVEALRHALKSEDKNLRAAAGLALVYDDKSRVFLRHWHEVVPALISSFDTDLVIRRPGRENPFDVVFLGIGFRLQEMIGDEMAFSEFLLRAGGQSSPSGSIGASIQKAMLKDLNRNRDAINGLKSYWQQWWNLHSKEDICDVASGIIERNIKILQDNPPLAAPGAIAFSSLYLWTGAFLSRAEDAGLWWTKNRATFCQNLKTR